MKLREFNYFGFNHDAVKKKFGEKLQFVCEMPVPIMTKHGPVPLPCAVYYNPEPDLKKSHKDYMLIFSNADTYFVAGRSHKEMNMVWDIPGVVCRGCDTVLVSIDRHHFVQCGCENETFLDGGMDYQRIGGKDLSLIENVMVDMQTGAIKNLTRRT